MYKLIYSEEAKKQISKFSLKIKRQLKKAIERLALDPSLGKKLSKELSGFQSYRTGDYRIIYQTDHGKLLIFIFTVGDRKNIYLRANRKLQ